MLNQVKLLAAVLAGWINRRQHQAIAGYCQEMTLSDTACPQGSKTHRGMLFQIFSAVLGQPRLPGLRDDC